MASGDHGYNKRVKNPEECRSGMRLPPVAPGLVSVPPSKSHVLRALMLSAASGRSLELRYAHGASWDEAGEDIQRGVACAAALGSARRGDPGPHGPRADARPDRTRGGCVPRGGPRIARGRDDGSGPQHSGFRLLLLLSRAAGCHAEYKR